jgi:ATP-dependent Clp protease ATP-binding subunit ClpC
MTFNVPVFVEEKSSDDTRSPSFTVQPLFAQGPTQRADKLSRALARLTNDLQTLLHELGREPRHEALSVWTFQPPLKDATLELRLDLESGSHRLRLFFAGYPALDRELWFSPSVPDLRFELAPGQDLAARATEVLTRHFRQAEREGYVDLSEIALTGKARLMVIPITVQPGGESRKKDKDSRAQLFGDEEKVDGELELRRVGRPLHALYPDDLDRAIGLDREVEELARLLAASDRRPVVLVGPRKVGKTTLLHELAWRMVHRKRERYGGGRELWLVSPMRLISGMSHLGEWENRVTAILDHAARKDRVLYFDDLLGLFSAGQSNASDLTVAQVLKPALTRRSVRIVAEITPEAWRILRERDRAFADLFHVIPLSEPPEADTLRVLIDVVRRLEQDQACRFDLEVIPATYELHRRHAGDAAFPGKAASFLQRLARRHASGQISRETVLDEFHRISGLQIALLDDRIALDRTSLLRQLRERITGQDHALDAFADVLVPFKARLNDPRRPLGTLLLLGPTGVGKTESAKALARLLFGSDERLLRFDMNEFVDGVSTARLTGTPQNPDGLLTGAIRRQPFSVVLLDEFEKAAPEVSDLLLAVLDEGRLTDSLGRVADFTQSVILLTSNLGSREARSQLGFRGGADSSGEDAIYIRAAEQFFRPEFFNRIDRVIPFRSLDAGHLDGIARKLIHQVLSRDGLRRRQCMLHTTIAASERLVQLGNHPQLGARALKRVVERELTQPLAARLASTTDTVPMIAVLDASPSGFHLRTRIVESVKPSNGWPAAAERLGTIGGSHCPPALIDAIHESLDQIQTQLEPEAPAGPIEIGALPRAHARYFLCRERIDHIRQRLETLEGPTRPHASPTINRRPTAKPIKVVAHSQHADRSRLSRQRAAAALEADLADLVEATPRNEDRSHSPLVDVLGDLALLHAIASGPPELQVALTLCQPVGESDAQFASSLSRMLAAPLTSVPGVTLEILHPDTPHQPIVCLLQGINLHRLLTPGPSLVLLDQPDGSIRFLRFDVVLTNSETEARRLRHRMLANRSDFDLDQLGPLRFRGSIGVDPAHPEHPVVTQLTDLHSGSTQRPRAGVAFAGTSLLLSALPLPSGIEQALATDLLP